MFSGLPDNRLPRKPLLGEVGGLPPPGRPRASFNNKSRDCQTQAV